LRLTHHASFGVVPSTWRRKMCRKAFCKCCIKQPQVQQSAGTSRKRSSCWPWPSTVSFGRDQLVDEKAKVDARVVTLEYEEPPTKPGLKRTKVLPGADQIESELGIQADEAAEANISKNQGQKLPPLNTTLPHPNKKKKTKKKQNNDQTLAAGGGSGGG